MGKQKKILLSKERYNNLKSKYLDENYKNDSIAIDDIEIVDKNTLRTLLKVKQFTLDKENRFHLSSITALVFFQQLSIVSMLLDLDKPNNDVEFYTTECHLKMSKPITTKVISLETTIVSTKVAKGCKFYNISASFENDSFVFEGLGVVRI